MSLPKYPKPCPQKAPFSEIFLWEIFQFTSGGEPNGYEKVTINATAAGLTVPDGTEWAEFRNVLNTGAISNTQKAILHRLDAAPTATDGMPYPDGSLFTVVGRCNLDAIQFISADAGATHELFVTYYKHKDTP